MEPNDQFRQNPHFNIKIQFLNDSFITESLQLYAFFCPHIRVVHSESHPIFLSGFMLIPLISNLGSILHWFWPHYLWSCIGQFLWEKILHLMFCWHFSQSLCKVCNTSCKPNHETGQINLDLSMKSVLLMGYLIWFAGSVADFTQWLGKMSTKHQVENLLS